MLFILFQWSLSLGGTLQYASPLNFPPSILLVSTLHFVSQNDSEQFYSKISLCADNIAQAVLLIEQFLYADNITYKAVYMQTVQYYS